jgi:hypothetical protein
MHPGRFGSAPNEILRDSLLLPLGSSLHLFETCPLRTQNFKLGQSSFQTKPLRSETGIVPAKTKAHAANYHEVSVNRGTKKLPGVSRAATA